LLLIGARGNIAAPAAGNRFESVQNAPHGEHGEKPPIFSEMIENMFSGLPRLAMFCRVGRPGWEMMDDKMNLITATAAHDEPR
jgi:N6-adenosine-specific RNA methylase IME4